MDGLPDLDAQVAFGVHLYGADGAPVLRRGARPCSLRELSLPHPAPKVARPAHSLIGRHVALAIPELHPDAAALCEPAAVPRIAQVLVGLFEPKLPGLRIHLVYGP